MSLPRQNPTVIDLTFEQAALLGKAQSSRKSFAIDSESLLNDPSIWLEEERLENEPSPSDSEEDSVAWSVTDAPEMQHSSKIYEMDNSTYDFFQIPRCMPPGFYVLRPYNVTNGYFKLYVRDDGTESIAFIAIDREVSKIRRAFYRNTIRRQDAGYEGQYPPPHYERPSDPRKRKRA
jgi:hypothetical protein